MTKVLLFLSVVLMQILFAKIEAKPSFIVVAPKQLDVGNAEKIQITLLDIERESVCTIRLLNVSEENENSGVFNEVKVSFEKGGSRTVDFSIPSNIPSYVATAQLQAICDFQDYSANKSNEISLRRKSLFVFINTDKPIYKEGQTVKFRVLAVTPDLKPPATETVGDIWINDPNRIRIAQWKNISLNKGLIQRQFQLPEEPVLGRWTVNLELNETLHIREFIVKEYVLPTFEVIVTPPSYILITDQNITWTICAKYTYGKPVVGNLTTKMTFLYVYRAKLPVIQNSERISGCRNVTITFDKFMTENGIHSHGGFQMTAQVIEDGTGKNASSSASVNPTHSPFTIERVDPKSDYFRPGLPLTSKVIVKKPDSQPKPDELISVCTTSRREKWKHFRSATDTTKSCKNYTTDNQGAFLFTIPPQHPSTISINVQLEAANFREDVKASVGMSKPSNSFTLKSWYSDNSNHLQIGLAFSKLKCNEINNIPVKYTTNDSTTKNVYYQIMSRGEIVHEGTHSYTFNTEEDLSNYEDDTYLPKELDLLWKEGQNWDNENPQPAYVGQFTLNINTIPSMAPKARLIIYGVNNGSIIADSTFFEVEPCFDNKVKLKFGQEVQQPGSKTSIGISATPQSLCSVGVVDKSVYILKEGDPLTNSKIYEQLNSLDIGPYSSPHQPTNDYEYCRKKQNTSARIPWDGYMVSVGYVDAITAFSEAGVVVLSNLELETRPCKPNFGVIHRPIFYTSRHRGPAPISVNFKSRPLSATGMRSRNGGANRVQHMKPLGSYETTTTVRKDFPENWLWLFVTVGDDGSLVLNETVPDTITEWQGQAVCAHPDTGVGVSETASLVAFQPFFSSITLPYSIVRGETLPVIVTVSNYLKETLAVKIHLDQTDDFVLSHGEVLSKSLCIDNDGTSTVSFLITPKTLGRFNITVTAATSQDETICENFDISDIVRSDTITKPLLVEAEGLLKEETKNVFFCMEDLEGENFKTEHDILIGEDTVEGSQRAYVSVTGDLMGPTLEGLNNLVRLPTGCGEQNMIRLVPNILVLDYLISTNRLRENIKNQAEEHIKTGYRRQQNYIHLDGSYSAFGKHDLEGSIWLTGFVVRSFASASRYIPIDKEQLQKSRNWIISRQQPNGCFPMIGKVHHQALKGGVKEDKTPVALTCYLLASLLESGSLNDSITASAIQCIHAQNNPTDYTLALCGYAISLVNTSSAADYLQKLYENSVLEGRYRYWKNTDKSIAIETAAYAILTTLERGDSKTLSLQKAAPIALWLTQQRNSHGGFSSTQDTMVALQALAKYSTLISSNPLDMKLNVRSDNLEREFQLNKANELLTQRTRLPVLPTSIQLEANGKGCALVQIAHRYNINSTDDSSDFELSVKAERKAGNCKNAEIFTCTSYKAKNESNMVVMEIKMASGFVPNKESIQKLLNIPSLEIRRFEIEENKVNLYFVQLTSEEKCFSFDVTQETVIEDRKPSNVVIYDYYSQDKKSSATYSIDDVCKETK